MAQGLENIKGWELKSDACLLGKLTQLVMESYWKVTRSVDTFPEIDGANKLNGI